MRIACLQFAPQVGDVDNNLNRADSVLNKANPEDLDLLVLPELAFSGYNFKSLQQISPFLEPSGSGISSLWARTTALKYDCIVAVGYPEKVDVSSMWPTSPLYYNSVIMVNGDGETIANYRKTHLYYTDETWALEGPDGFFEGHINGLGRTAMGICMDLNPYRFEAPWHAFEFAFHILHMNANLVIVSMAWNTREDARMYSRMPKEPDMETLTYWITRLEPVIRSESEDEIIVVFCNRTGAEQECVYAGTSAVIGIKDGEVSVYGLLGRGDKELLVVDTDSPPFAQLVYRPGDSTSDLQSNLGSRGSSALNPPSQPPEVPREPKDSGDATKRIPTPNPPNAGSHHNTSYRSKKASPPFSPNSRSTKSSRSSDGRYTKLSPSNSPRRNPQHDIGKSSRAAKPSPKITIPANDPAQKEGVPTPTAPSPTPIELRPDFGHSTAKSSSNKTQDQVLTPHPNSGRMVDPWHIYGGHVSVKQQPFSPVTPFPEIPSPASPRYFWVPSDTLLKTPALPNDSSVQHDRTSKYSTDSMTTIHSGSNLDLARRNGALKKSTPRPEHKPAPKATSKPAPRPVTKASPSRSPSKAASPRKTQKLKQDDDLDLRSPPKSEVPQPDRPSSPKSRNTSRQRGLERPNSALAQAQHLASINYRLDAVSKRPASAMGQIPVSNSHSNSGPVRPSSPKSRNTSRTRPDNPVLDQRLTNISRSSILIAASPSIYDHQSVQRPRSTSMQNHVYDNGTGSHVRNASFSRGRNGRPGSAFARYSERPQSRTGRSETPMMPVNFVDGPERDAISRGRPRESRHYPAERSHSGNSTWPEPPASRFPSPSPRRLADADEIIAIEGTVSPNCPVHGANHPAGEHTVDEIIAIEGTISPNCPVHGAGSRPPTGDRRRTESAQRRTESAQRRSSLQRRTSTHQRTDGSQRRRESVQRRHESAHRNPSGSPHVQYVQRRSPPDRPSFSASNQSEKPSPIASTSVETLATPNGSPSTPQYHHEPTTPKAMILFHEEELIPMTPNADAVTKEVLKPLICRDRDVTKTALLASGIGHGLHRPKSAIW